jgi:hypothetical protein
MKSKPAWIDTKNIKKLNIFKFETDIVYGQCPQTICYLPYAELTLTVCYFMLSVYVIGKQNIRQFLDLIKTIFNCDKI